MTLAVESHVADSTVQVSAFPTDLGWMALSTDDTFVYGLVFGHATPQAAIRRLKNRSRAIQRLAGESVGILVKSGTVGSDVVSVSANSDCHSLADELAERLERYACGEPVDFSDLCLANDDLTSFARKVVAACRRISWGTTRSYAQLACAAGSPKAARAVGQVMAHNRFPLIVPCHRVLSAGGRLGGFSAPQGIDMKRRLLALEGFEHWG